MKKRLVLIAVLTLLLTACARQPSQGSPSSAGERGGGSSASEEQADSFGTPESLGREETASLSITLEGLTEEIPSTLFIGDGFSLYVPDEGWEKTWVSGWQSVNHPDVEIRVETHTGKSVEEVADSISGYAPSPLKDEEGSAEGEQCLYLRIIEGPGDRVYAVLGKYPQEVEEGFGARLEAIGWSVEANEFASTVIE
ncbi:hypothetical protein KQI82_00475 [Oscillibacter sp. MSJ-2]|uniref:Uncharacterized protein n=1 Tax=Dysosmobacter acutus TaxID=2841504 RepID=A0ABS6F571_9FIRM|nr:hypothetical protein [Dysosmobacter acutus]MBU5625410.1 hypothetical protein [Dysosmobacter acutus]